MVWSYLVEIQVGKDHYPLDDESKMRIEADPDPLVRYCLLESQYAQFNPLLNNPDEFFNLPQEARLALVRRMVGGGNKVAALISHAVDHQLKKGIVSEIELFEILSDYMNKAEFKNHYKDDIENPSSDGWKEYDKGRDIDSLWRLVPQLPEVLSHILIENLPPGAGMSPGIPDDVLQGVSDRQLTTLLYRQDIELPEFRKRIFFEADKERSEVKYAAISHHFDFQYRELAEILAKPDQERMRILAELTGAGDLSLCLYAAIFDILSRSEKVLSHPIS